MCGISHPVCPDRGRADSEAETRANKDQQSRDKTRTLQGFGQSEQALLERQAGVGRRSHGDRRTRVMGSVYCLADAQQRLGRTVSVGRGRLA